MRKAGVGYCLMLYDSQDFPIAYFDNYKEAAIYLKSSAETIMCAILRHEGRMRGGLNIKKIKIDKED